MRRWMGAAAAAGVVAATAAWAQERGPFGPEGGPGGRHRLSQQDREAFADARIAALHAGLKLTPDQEKLWPPVEAAIRDLVRQRREAQALRQERFAAMRADGPREAGIDIPAQLRFMADRQAASAESLRKLADASGPLYAALDDGQKRRLAVLSRGLRPGGPRHGQEGGWRRGGGWER